MADDLDPAAVERAARAICPNPGAHYEPDGSAFWHDRDCKGIARAALTAAGLLVTPEHKPTRCCAGPVSLRLDGTWLVEEHPHHTCGAGPGSGAGHEPGCGLVPLDDLTEQLAAHDAQVAARALREAAQEVAPGRLVGPGWLHDRADRIERQGEGR